MMNMAESLYLGIKGLMFSANTALEDENIKGEGVDGKSMKNNIWHREIACCDRCSGHNGGLLFSAFSAFDLAWATCWQCCIQLWLKPSYV